MASTAVLSSLQYSPPVIAALNVLRNVADDGIVLPPNDTSTDIDCTRMDIVSGLPQSQTGGTAVVEITGSNFGVSARHTTVTVHGVQAPLLLLRDSLAVVRTPYCAGG